MDLSSEQKCIRCGSEDLVEDRGYSTCYSCGLINREVLSESDEISYTDSNNGRVENNSRVGAASQSPYDSLSTYIPRGFFITIQKEDGTIIKKDLAKIHMIISQTSKEKSFNITVQGFERLFDINKVPKSVVQHSKSIWEAIVEKNKNIYRGSNRNGILGCCILYSCYKVGIPMSRKDLCDIMKITPKDIGNGEPIFRDLVRGTEYADILEFNSKNSTQVSFTKYIEELDLPFMFAKECETLYKNISTGISNLKDKSLIAGIIVKVIQNNNMKKPTKKQIAESIGITIPTLNKAVKAIEDNLT